MYSTIQDDAMLLHVLSCKFGGWALNIYWIIEQMSSSSTNYALNEHES